MAVEQAEFELEKAHGNTESKVVSLKNEEFKSLQDLIDNSGEVVSPTDGAIISVDLKTERKTTGKEVLIGTKAFCRFNAR